MKSSASSISKTTSYSELRQNKLAHSTVIAAAGATSGKHAFTPKKEIVPPNKYTSAHKRSQTSTFQNDDTQQLKETIQSISQLHNNSPTFKLNNPITSEGHPEQVFRSSVKKTAYSDIDNLKSPLPPKIQRTSSNADFGYLRNQTESKDWKPSVKQVSQKDSEHFEVFERRGLKSASSNRNVGVTSSVNPLLGQEEKIQRSRLTGNGDQVISAQYQKIADRKGLQSAHSATRNQWQQYKQSNIFSNSGTKDTTKPGVACLTENPMTVSQFSAVPPRVPQKFAGNEAKSLISYGFALPFDKTKEPTQKVGLDKNRFLSFNQANDCDFRKRSNRLEKEEAFALSKQYKNENTPQRSQLAKSQIQLAV